MNDQNPRFFPGKPRQQQLLLDWRSYGGTRTSRLLLRLSWCGRSSYPSSLMPVRAGHWQTNSKEGSKPWRWDAIRDFRKFPTNTIWRTRRFATESRIQLECMMISCPWRKNGNSDRMATSQDPLVWWRQFCGGQWKEQEREEDRRRDGKITSKNGQEWSLEIPWGQRKTVKGGKVLLQRCAPTTVKVKRRRWDERYYITCKANKQHLNLTNINPAPNKIHKERKC